MPIYEYECEHCGHALEAIQKVSDTPLSICPECGKPALKKLVSAAGFRLKGTGWYETDFKHRGKKPAEKADDKKEDKKEGKKESTTAAPDSKPAAGESKDSSKPVASGSD